MALAIHKALIVISSSKYLKNGVEKPLAHNPSLVIVGDPYAVLSILRVVADSIRSDHYLIWRTSASYKHEGLHTWVQNFPDDYKAIGSTHPCATLDNTLYSQGFLSQEDGYTEYVGLDSSLHAAKCYMSVLIALEQALSEDSVHHII